MPLYSPTEVGDAQENPGGVEDRDPAWVLLANAQFLIDRSALGGEEAVVAMAVMTKPVEDHTPWELDGPAFAYAERFLDAARDGDEEELGHLPTDQAATDSQEQDWAAANTDTAVISGFQIEQDEPLMVVWSSPEQQRYTGFSIVLDDDAPEEDTDQAVIEVGYLVRLGWGT